MLAEQSSSHTILLVEDDDLQARLYRTMLYRERGTEPVATDEEKGETVTTVETVRTLEDARTALEDDAESFDLVLLDLNLPDSLGLETLDSVLETVDGTAVVVLTGIDDTEIGRKAVERGAEDYLVKDRVTPRLLDRTVTYAVERRRRTPAKRASGVTLAGAPRDTKRCRRRPGVGIGAQSDGSRVGADRFPDRGSGRTHRRTHRVGRDDGGVPRGTTDRTRPDRARRRGRRGDRSARGTTRGLYGDVRPPRGNGFGSGRPVSQRRRPKRVDERGRPRRRGGNDNRERLSSGRRQGRADGLRRRTGALGERSPTGYRTGLHHGRGGDRRGSVPRANVRRPLRRESDHRERSGARAGNDRPDSPRIRALTR
ncbi:response regulator receiver protein [Natronococcus amylolyticus DSM 10524]|uniref:Response regulator receiver protein n=1 Tax=Natronococcus amylolyticus DSM 10524 TaxID=1227497 RepID=L9XBZ4_9EURY|nr:response regulator receiver protein [Natronococcus amylolyticus DSM 10524]